MPRKLTQQECEQFLAEPRVAVVGVAAGAGRPPLLTPTWYAYRPGGEITFFTGTQGRRARKSRLMDAAGVVTVSVQQPEPPYRYVTVEGTVVGADRPPAPEAMRAVADRYLPPEMAAGFVADELAHPGPDLVLYSIRPDRWLSMDFGED